MLVATVNLEGIVQFATDFGLVAVELFFKPTIESVEYTAPSKVTSSGVLLA